LFVKGKKIKTRSFKIGSVTILENHDSPAMWKDMEHWVCDNVKPSYGKVTAVGTGGNISKIFELAQKKSGAALSLKKVKAIKEEIESLTIDQRIYQLQMNPDRADVIVPASGIYIKVMEWVNSKSIIVPDVGLKDGILLHVLERAIKQRKIDFKK
ncbi:MAG: phosphatase, partial [Cyclobacteriaceae bacterium]|nr:phosphatase [Cyclobacteriaceae bacterium]